MIGAAIETHLVAAQQYDMLHHRRGDHAGAYCDAGGARGLISSKRVNTQADARRSLKGSRFAKNTQGSKSAFLLILSGGELKALYLYLQAAGSIMALLKTEAAVELIFIYFAIY